MADLQQFHSVQIDDLYIRCALYEALLKRLLAGTPINVGDIRDEVIAAKFGTIKSTRFVEDRLEEVDLTLARLGIPAAQGRE